MLKIPKKGHLPTPASWGMSDNTGFWADCFVQSDSFANTTAWEMRELDKAKEGYPRGEAVAGGSEAQPQMVFPSHGVTPDRQSWAEWDSRWCIVTMLC